MGKEQTVLAIDLGASSGRVVKASYNGNGRIYYEEIHRFENCPYEANGRLCWNFPALLSEIHTGIDKSGKFNSVGVDTWGVDFGLLDADGKLLEDPVHYRDNRTEGMIEEALLMVTARSLYAETGTQILPINTLFQLLALQKQQPELLQKADRLLFMPDLFTYALCGNSICEQSIASTSQLLALPEGTWNRRLLETFQVPERLFIDPVSSGTIAGTLPNGGKVIAVAGHDTQCAIAAMPAQEENAVFLSCGTWSLLGCELDAPILTEYSMQLGLSNELGANGKVNYLKNIVGLWLIQESRREWQRQGQNYSYTELENLALKSESTESFIDPDAPVFATPGNIPGRIQAYCATTNQPIPRTAGAVMHCIYESLALKYRFAIEQVQAITGKKYQTLHILGGGSKDRLLCRMTAAATGLRVIAGPAEATALGNIIIQLVASGILPSINTGRQLIAQSEKLAEYLPVDVAVWNKKYMKFQNFLCRALEETL